MEQHHPREPDDQEPDVPELEKLAAGEIDMTGAISQEDKLYDTIADALIEAESSGELPDWGARVIARALANRLYGTSGALHHYAVTGRIDRVGLARELAVIYTSTADEEERDWVSRLADYLVGVVKPTTPTEGPEHTEQDDTAPAAPSDASPPMEILLDGTPLEQVSVYLRIAFAEADARGEPISREDAQAVAHLLGPQLPPGSAMSRFAETGNADPAALSEECRELKQRSWDTPDVVVWLEHFERYLAGQDTTRQPTEHPDPERPLDVPQVLDGLSAHGDAFRAYLQLPDVDPYRDDLMEQFEDCYVGAFGSMEALLEEITELRDWKRVIDAVAKEHGFDQYVSIDLAKIEATVRAGWDIIKLGGTFYAFSK
jgi:hypothetical protein